MALKLGLVRLKSPEVLGTQDFEPQDEFSNDNIFSNDCVAAIGFNSGAETNGVIASRAQAAFGITDGTTDYSVMIGGDDAVTPSDWRTILRNIRFVGVRDHTAATLCAATADIISTGVRLDWLNVTNQRLINVLMFGGSGVQARTATVAFTNPGIGETRSVSYTPFSGNAQPDFLMCLGNGRAVESNGAAGDYSLGFFDRLNSTYICSAGNRADASAAESAVGALFTDCVMASLGPGGGITYKVTVGNFNGTAGTFDAISSANASTNAIAFLLLRIPGAGVKTGTFDLPTDTNAFTPITGVTKRPKGIILLPTRLTSVNSVSTTDSGSAFGMSAIIDNAGLLQQQMILCSSDDNANPVVNKSLTINRAVRMLNADGTVQGACDVTVRNADGWTLQNTEAPAVATKIGYITFGDEDALPEIRELSVEPLVAGSPVTITGISFSTVANTVTWGTVNFAENTRAFAQIVTQNLTVGINTFGDEYNLKVNDGTGDSNLFPVSMVPAAGERFYNLSGGININSSIRFSSVPELADNAQIHITAATDALAGSVDLSLIGINPDGTPFVDISVATNRFPIVCTARANNRNGDGWGAFESVTLGLVAGGVGGSQKHAVRCSLAGIIIR